MNTIKIEHSHRAIEVPDIGLTGDLRDAYCDGAGAALEAALAWISVEDALPEPIRDVLIIREGGATVGFLGKSGAWMQVGFCREFKVTHWMPLPALPEVRDAD